jgi:hypothetical protein
MRTDIGYIQIQGDIGQIHGQTNGSKEPMGEIPLLAADAAAKGSGGMLRWKA